MKRGKLEIKYSAVTISGEVWMADFEIAELFGVRYSVVRRAIATILKSGAIREDYAKRYITLESGNRADVYNLEIIIALAFHIDSVTSQTLRRWVLSRVRGRTGQPIFINVGSGVMN